MGVKFGEVVRTLKVSVTNVLPALADELERRSAAVTSITFAAARLGQLYFTAWFASELPLTEGMRSESALVTLYREAASAVSTGGRATRCARPQNLFVRCAGTGKRRRGLTWFG